MKLSKKDIKLIGEFIDKKNPKVELNFALVGNGGVFATDSRRAIKFHIAELQGERLLHKKLLKGFEGMMSKDDSAGFLVGASGVHLECNNVALDVDTGAFEHKYPDSDRILDQKLGNHFVLSNLDDIHFELTNRYCFVEWGLVAPLIEHGRGDKYDVFYEPQSEDSSGMVKVVASVEDEELGSVVLYTAVIMGREFKSQAKE